MNFHRNFRKTNDKSFLALFVVVAFIFITVVKANPNPNPLYGVAASVHAANEIDRERQGTSSNLANSNNRPPPIRPPFVNSQQSVDLRPPVRRRQHGGGSSNIRPSTPRPSPYPQRWFIEYFLPENWQFWRWRTSKNKDVRRKSRERPYRRHQQPPLENKWRRRQQSQYNTGN